ncbi:hypothetical protein [Leptobacterium sp. I13]|uniref:hypothetical protein n=1 Tax=Leptobacterium meishanense TaxID=3128904 RepID=UPI0030EE15DD
MDEPKKNNSLKVIAILLGILFVATLVYTVTLYNDKKETVAKLTEEKDLVIEDLNNLKADYDRAIEENETTNQELLEARDRINQYIDSVKAMKADISALYKYRRQVRVLEKERAFLMAQNDSLRKSNALLTMERDSTFAALEQQTVLSDSLVIQNTQLAKVLEIGSALNLSKFSVDAVRERSSGKLVSTNRAKRADKIKICYTVAANRIADSGDKQFYIQVLDPSGNILGENGIASNEEGANVTYSKISNFFYENSSLDVCDYVSKPASGFSKGGYEVKVYDTDLRELATSRFIFN